MRGLSQFLSFPARSFSTEQKGQVREEEKESVYRYICIRDGEKSGGELPRGS